MGVRAAWITGGLGLLGVILVIIFKQSTVSQSANNSREAILAGRDVNVNIQREGTIAPLKERIRTYLRTVNPKIIELLDSGQCSVAVMINVVNQQALSELQKDQPFLSS